MHENNKAKSIYFNISEDLYVIWMKEKSISILTFLYWEWKFQICQKCHHYSWILRHLSLSQKWKFRACRSTEKVKEAQRCGVAVVIKYKSGSWKGGWRKIWLCGGLEKMYQNRLFISSASERMKNTVGGIKVGKRYCFPCKVCKTLHVEGSNIYWATEQTTCQAQGREVLPLVREAPGCECQKPRESIQMSPYLALLWLSGLLKGISESNSKNIHGNALGHSSCLFCTVPKRQWNPILMH